MSRLYDLFTAHPAVSTDSRRVTPDSLFFALRGASFDGNRFAAEALARGAVRAVVDDPATAATDPERMILVRDALAALQDLAREHRRALGIPILAITGSNGKTTTKELVSRVLAERFEVCATRGNLNNHIGLPLTLLSMTRDTEFGVVEMGASACGEIALLCSVAEPNYGLITNIGHAHLAGFGGPEGVQRGKGELYDYLAENGGRAFVASNDDTLVAMAVRRDPLAVEYYPAALGDGVENRLEGAYNRANIAAAVAVGRYFDVDETRIRHAIASYLPDNCRSQRTETGRNTLVVDCYNANPSSMRAALRNFRTEQLGDRTSKVLILGDMLELGAWSREEHAGILEAACAIPDARILAVGREFAAACDAIGALPSAARKYGPPCSPVGEPCRDAPKSAFSGDPDTGAHGTVWTSGSPVPDPSELPDPAFRTKLSAAASQAARTSAEESRMPEASRITGFSAHAAAHLSAANDPATALPAAESASGRLSATEAAQPRSAAQECFPQEAAVRKNAERESTAREHAAQGCDTEESAAANPTDAKSSARAEHVAGRREKDDCGTPGRQAPEWGGSFLRQDHPGPPTADAPRPASAAGTPLPPPEQACAARILRFPSRDELAAFLSEHPVRNALVLIKGSRGIGLEKIVELL